VKKSKMQVQDNQDKHVKLSMLSLAVSNKSLYTSFRPKSYTLVSCNSYMCLYFTFWLFYCTSLYNRL